MNIKLTLKDVCSACNKFKEGRTDEQQLMGLIIRFLSQDERIIPTLLEILEQERTRNKELRCDMETNLARLMAFADDEISGVRNTKARKEKKKWLVEQAKNFYLKWQKFILCNMKIKGLP